MPSYSPVLKNAGYGLLLTLLLCNGHILWEWTESNGLLTNLQNGVWSVFKIFKVKIVGPAPKYRPIYIAPRWVQPAFIIRDSFTRFHSVPYIGFHLQVWIDYSMPSFNPPLRVDYPSQRLSLDWIKILKSTFIVLLAERKRSL